MMRCPRHPTMDQPSTRHAPSVHPKQPDLLLPNTKCTRCGVILMADDDPGFIDRCEKFARVDAEREAWLYPNR